MCSAAGSSARTNACSFRLHRLEFPPLSPSPANLSNCPFRTPWSALVRPKEETRRATNGADNRDREKKAPKVDCARLRHFSQPARAVSICFPLHHPPHPSPILQSLVLEEKRDRACVPLARPLKTTHLPSELQHPQSDLAFVVEAPSLSHPAGDTVNFRLRIPVRSSLLPPPTWPD